MDRLVGDFKMNFFTVDSVVVCRVPPLCVCACACKIVVSKSGWRDWNGGHGRNVREGKEEGDRCVSQTHSQSQFIR